MYPALRVLANLVAGNDTQTNVKLFSVSIPTFFLTIDYCESLGLFTKNI